LKPRELLAVRSDYGGLLLVSKTLWKEAETYWQDVWGISRYCFQADSTQLVPVLESLAAANSLQVRNLGILPLYWDIWGL